MRFRVWVGFVLVALAMASTAAGSAQAPAQDSKGDSPSASVAYPHDQAGILIKDLDWISIPQTMPTKSKAKHGLAASLSYGAVPAAIVAEYAGSKAATQIADQQPTICICHLLSLPGQPLLVRLRVKKEIRELDGGRLPILGAKLAEAKESDMVPIDVSQPEKNVWLIRPKAPIAEGEYALMLGPQNVAISPFGVSAPPAKTPAVEKK